MYYFFNTIKKYIIGTLSLFDNIIVQKSDSRQFTVPVVFANKSRLNQYIATEFQKNRGAKVIPKIAVSISGMQFDTERKTNKISKIPLQYDGTANTTSIYNSVPYNWIIDVHIITRTLSDMFQILEQILPKFNPSVSININELPLVSNSSSVTILLNDVSLEIDSDLDEVGEQRYVRASLNLLLKGNIFMPIKDSKIIKQIDISYLHEDSNLPEKYILQGA